MATAPSYDRRPVCPKSPCPRCRRPVFVSRCHAAREDCGHCGFEWTPAPRTQQAGVH